MHRRGVTAVVQLTGIERGGNLTALLAILTGVNNSSLPLIEQAILVATAVVNRGACRASRRCGGQRG